MFARCIKLKGGLRVLALSLNHIGHDLERETYSPKSILMLLRFASQRMVGPHKNRTPKLGAYTTSTKRYFTGSPH